MARPVDDVSASAGYGASFVDASLPLRNEVDPRRLRQILVVLALYVVAMFAFGLLHPVLEWPDAEVHLSDACQEEAAFPPKAFLEQMGQDVCGLAVKDFALNDFRFFTDRSISSDLHAVNPIWAYIIFPIVCVIAMVAFIVASGNRDAVGNPFVFAPPLAFYLANINVEVFGYFIVIGGYFIFRTRPKLAILLTIAATAIDRSHVCSFFTFVLIYMFASARSWMYLCVVGGALSLYLARILGLLDILDLITLAFESVSILGVTGDDIMFNAEFGGRGYAALIASAGGLYGAMSYRPVLWFIYYAAFFGLFVLGYARGEQRERRVFWLSVTAALCIMIILPPLSQARFYPVLILSMWSMVIKGGRWFGIPSMRLQVLFFCWTMVSLVVANLNHIAEA